jgi:ABC-2 type transport system ATP-binding protein
MYAKIGDFELKDLNLNIPRGSIVGLVGRNGAGKTTLFKSLNGTYLKTSGDMIIDGKDFVNAEKEIRMNLAVVYDVINCNPYAKVKLLQKIYKQSHPKFDNDLFESLIKRFNIEPKKRVIKLSLGMQKKLMLILALAVHPTILLLDEPLIGIDPFDKTEFIKLIQEYMEDENNTVILSSHQVDDIQKIADYVIFLNDGKIVLFEEKDVLLDSYKFVTLEPNDNNSHILINPSTSSVGVKGLIKTEDVNKLSSTTQPATLEQIFINLCS